MGNKVESRFQYLLSPIIGGINQHELLLYGIFEITFVIHKRLHLDPHTFALLQRTTDK